CRRVHKEFERLRALGVEFTQDPLRWVQSAPPSPPTPAEIWSRSRRRDNNKNEAPDPVFACGLSSGPAAIRLGSKTKFGLRADARETIVADPVGMKTTRVSPVILAEGLTKRYGTVQAVNDLSFAVRPGAVTGFLGPNGAGKTTALKLIVGLARPTAGRAPIYGTPVSSKLPGPDMLGAYIEPCGAHPGRSGRNHLRSLAALASLPPSPVDQVLALVELEQAAGRRIGTYSTGMRQRLGLAAALLGDPQILVLDEPLNGLDPQGIRWLRTFLRERAA